MCIIEIDQILLNVSLYNFFYVNYHYYTIFLDDVRQDFDSTVRTMFFPANSPIETERSISFPIFDDAIDEEREGFIIVLYRDTNLTSIEVAFTPNLRTTLGRINDNDREHTYQYAWSISYFSLPQLSSLVLLSMR